MFAARYYSAFGIRYLPLEMMDLQINPKDQTLMPNPANNGKWVMDLL